VRIQEGIICACIVCYEKTPYVNICTAHFYASSVVWSSGCFRFEESACLWVSYIIENCRALHCIPFYVKIRCVLCAAHCGKKCRFLNLAHIVLSHWASDFNYKNVQSGLDYLWYTTVLCYLSELMPENSSFANPDPSECYIEIFCKLKVW